MSTYRMQATALGAVSVSVADLRRLVEATVDELCARCDGLLRGVRTVGVASFSHSLVGLDAGGRPLTPVLSWADTEWDGELLGAPPRDPDVHRRALEARATFRAEVVALMDEHDLDAIAYPASDQPAARIGLGSRTPSDCYSAALSGLPALVVPAGLTADGLPVGLELMARPFGESVLIALAAGYEANTIHRMLPPTTPPLDPAR